MHKIRLICYLLIYIAILRIYPELFWNIIEQSLSWCKTNLGSMIKRIFIIYITSPVIGYRRAMQSAEISKVMASNN